MDRRIPLPKQANAASQRLADEADRRHDRDRQLHDADRKLVKDVNGNIDIVMAPATDVATYHHFGHLPKGWRVVDRNKAGIVWRVSWDENRLVLRTSAVSDLTVRVEAF